MPLSDHQLELLSHFVCQVDILGVPHVTIQFLRFFGSDRLTSVILASEGYLGFRDPPYFVDPVMFITDKGLAELDRAGLLEIS